MLSKAVPQYYFVAIMVENGRDISRSVPPQFLYLTRSYSYFRTKTESVRKTGHEIRNRDEIGLGPIPIVFAYPVFISGYPEIKTGYAKTIGIGHKPISP